MNQISPPFYDWQQRGFKVYDPRRVFDDVLGEDYEPDVVEEIEFAVQRALDSVRLRPLPQDVTQIREDATLYTFNAPDKYMLGADIGGEEFSIFSSIRDRFRKAIGKPKLVRVDNEESYADFRAARREPYMESLNDRIARIEQPSPQRGFGDNDVEAFDEYLDYGDAVAESHEAVIGAVNDTIRGGQHVPLNLPGTEGKVECWLDGDEVLVSARFPEGIATTGVPLLPELEDVVGCAERLGCNKMQALTLGCHLAPAAAGKKILGDLCLNAPVLGYGVHVMRPRTDANLAAGMALLQRAQRGDRPSIREVIDMAHGVYRNFMDEARERLMRGQEEKASRG